MAPFGATDDCQFKRVTNSSRRERSVLWVVALTFVMMVIEITVGYFSHSMALLADGWHMATHVGALGITALAYTIARRFAGHSAFTFGTGKVHALAGYSSAILLGAVAVSMCVESVSRLFEPQAIDFNSSLPVAVIGLIVNLVSVVLLHEQEGHADAVHSETHPHHDHAHRAALFHVFADALTSALAIGALLLGKQFGLNWLDPATGLVGSIVILKWGIDLIRLTAAELLDAGVGVEAEREIRTALEAWGDSTILDLHVWPMGQGRFSCIITIESESPRPVEEYRRRILDAVHLSHLTVELRRLKGAAGALS